MPSTTTYTPGEVLLVKYPYTGGGGAAIRPALVLVDTGDADVLLARITSQPHTTAYDLRVIDWQGAGLRSPSFVRLHKLAAIDKGEVIRRLAYIQPADHAQVAAVLRQTYGNW